MEDRLDLKQFQTELERQTKEFGQWIISCEIALYTLLNLHGEEIDHVFKKLGCDSENLKKTLWKNNKLNKQRDSRLVTHTTLVSILKKCSKSGTYTMLTSLLLVEGEIPYYYFGLTYPEFHFREKIKDKYLTEVVNPVGNKNPKEIKIDHCVDMTFGALASDEPFFGREEELEQMILVLMRRKKNNVLLLGEAGVGKTALVEALAKKISKREVPEELWDSHVAALNLASLIGGASGRGEFEERVENLFGQIKKVKGKVILFIDEFHSIVGLGNDGSFDLANLLKPVLARKEIKVIGATTFREYQIYVEKDGALVRRFQSVPVLELDKEETYQLLRNVKETYEQYHKVYYQDEALSTCVDLADQYIMNRQFPDKALDILDDIGVIANRMMKKEVTPEMVRSFIAKKYKISIPGSNGEAGNEAGKLQVLLASLFGNEQEKLKLRKYLLVSQFMMQEENITNCLLEFSGISDCEKEEFIKAIRYSYFPMKEVYLELDLSTYQEKHTISKLIGAPPGYVGSQESGILVEKLKNFPRLFVVIRNAKAAHPDIIAFLKKVIQGSMVTDIWGNGYRMRNAVIIADECTEHGTKTGQSEFGEIAFGNVTFKPLTLDELEQATKVYMKRLACNLKKQNIVMHYDSSVMDWVRRSILKERKEEVVKRDISRNIIETIAELMADNSSKSKNVELYFENDKLEYRQGGKDYE
ncbi:AAA family ATPase [[Clostridium] polysaccharolyticum]|uniref:ATP-dependent Clp protease ATP-binding subunit ClpA n=1 Tax=[Clostridium] polysaccharolyticum TaxID=29364 RepID=A0A1H9Z9J8_9FIRM|nr:AAA family ATPase [[Clostridium] polysaccharolyticum]SES78239.1 ATP-dependent Clp protease ATP-binding subunit ClpA [[Clostridium] polysaccharolyticum]